jgi:hypothetical protein
MSGWIVLLLAFGSFVSGFIAASAGLDMHYRTKYKERIEVWEAAIAAYLRQIDAEEKRKAQLRNLN